MGADGGTNGVGPDPWQQLLLDELRGFRTETNQRFDRLVTNEAFAAEQKRRDEREADLAKADAHETTTREKHELAFEQRLDKLTANLRWVVAIVIVPIALFVANLIVQKGAP